jgi:hypothetical protein
MEPSLNYKAEPANGHHILQQTVKNKLKCSSFQGLALPILPGFGLSGVRLLSKRFYESPSMTVRKFPEGKRDCLSLRISFSQP